MQRNKIYWAEEEQAAEYQIKVFLTEKNMHPF